MWVLPNCVEVREGTAELYVNVNANLNLNLNVNENENQNKNKDKDKKDETLRYETWHSHYETERSSYEDKTAELYKNKDKNKNLNLNANLNENENDNYQLSIVNCQLIKNGCIFYIWGGLNLIRGWTTCWRR